MTRAVISRGATTGATAKKAPPRARAVIGPEPKTRADEVPEQRSQPDLEAVVVKEAGRADLAGALRLLLREVDAEVGAVAALSLRIDDLVGQLNDARDEQARRLIVLDTLQASVDDANLGAFLGKTIRPSKPRVVELMPERLTTF